jgi:metacaspase-1
MSHEIYMKNKGVYDTFQFLAGRAKDVDFAPSLILISGCQDSQLWEDGDQNGLFTENLLKVWDSGNFSGDYRKLWQEIGSHMPPSQTPNFSTLGDTNDFQQQRPFKIVTEQFDPSGSVLPVMEVLGAATRSRSDSAPNFQIDTAGAPYYIVEFATELDLFDSEHHDSDRTPEKFWASWSESPVFAMSNGFYPMPNSVWDKLKQSDQIYFRVGTTSTQGGWQDYRVSVPDEATDGPSLSLAA